MSVAVIPFNREIAGWWGRFQFWRCSRKPNLFFAFIAPCGCRRVSLNAWPIMPARLFVVPCNDHVGQTNKLHYDEPATRVIRNFFGRRRR